MLLPPPATHHHRQHHLMVDSQLLLVQLHLLKLLVQIRIRWDAGWPVLVLLELLVVVWVVVDSAPPLHA
ncbi:hypothetical protein Hdeb2414_s0026g00678951 [Helianthus debilis subsp. tardiflorus]